VRTQDHLYIRNFEPERSINLCREYWEGESGYSPTWISVKALPAESVMYQRIDGPRPEEELYDIKQDPFQLNNLAQDPDFAEIKEMLAADLEIKLRSTKDPRILGTFEEVFYIPHYINQEKQS